MTVAAGITRVDTNMKDRASARRENAIAIDHWEDEGGAGESAAKNSATPRSMSEGAATGATVGAGAGAGSALIQGRNDLELKTEAEFRIRARSRL